MEINKDILLNEYFQDALEETKKVVSMPSYRKIAEKGTPIDQDIRNVLDHCINLCKSFGMKTFIADDYKYGYADYGNGEKLFGIICHLDVVPPGNITEWNNPPFEPIEKDGKLFGRGSFDDKGPTMMNLFAFKYLIDNGFEPDYTIRFIFGTTEETTWECMESYVANERICDLGYVPDGHFPVVYAEKWIDDIDLIGEYDCDFEVMGGEVYNAVNDLVYYKGDKINEIQNYLNDNNISNYLENDKLYVKGVASHGSLPEKGVAASSWLLKAMDYIGIKHPLVQFVANYFHLDHNMEKVFGKINDETGDLTACNGILKITNKDFRFTINFRVPCTFDPRKDINDKLISFIKDFDMELIVSSIENSVYFAKDSDVVKKIMSVYQEVTGDYKSEPIAIGGGTFAKSMPNMIAFGAEFNIEESTMHAYNEYVKIDELKKMIEIYAKSIAKLTKL
ncbi:Sapep family Mn(2+)-dependent dipeptidase [Spiroplasma turonicum]|uniref:Dipeptidase PepV n=1 Tax=Spiroplasma turonicum TaxID=216946 RepID=A0A0K1P6L4_9MOLU|nr:Sapep family Mn(2+)-dependent dipeptidase [Spiroplasma turonicum]AKU79961.1 dipeptidase PepV [Spiroplasma turonicum]ALX70974.1 dipeptidase PepV [Spiroplasma turonicum]